MMFNGIVEHTIPLSRQRSPKVLILIIAGSEDTFSVAGDC
jgi:hypothetical protein